MRTLLPLLGLFLAACGTPSVTPETVVSFVPFQAPQHYTVRKGDTLALVSLAHNVAPSDLRAWNGLADDALKAGQTLLIFDLSGLDDVIDEVRPSSTRVAKKRSRSRKRSRNTRSRNTRTVAQAPTTPTYTPPARPTPRPRTGMRSLVSQAGIFGANLDEGLDNALLDTVASLTGSQSTVGQASLASAGSVGHGGSVERSAAMQRRVRHEDRGGWGAASVRAPSLSRPSAKRCLAGPRASQLKSDEGQLASRGLSSSQIRGTMNSFVRQTARCVPRDSKGSFTVQTEVTVACDGRVTNAWVNPDGVPANVRSCIEKTLTYASFPAHALPDGFSFRYPIKFRM